MWTILGGIRRRPLAMVAVAVLAIVVLTPLTAPLWSVDPNKVDTIHRLLPPSAGHLFGTDNFGRDILSRVAYGARVSLIIGALVAAIAVVLGTVSGLLTGYYRAVDSVLMRVLDGLMAFPSFLLAIALVGALGPSVRNEIIALAIAYWPRITRTVRASTLQLREGLFVEAALATGTKGLPILFRHILPNAVSPIIIQGTFVFAEAVLLDASLSFLGLGVAPPAPTWGNMLADSRTYLATAPWFSLFPGVAIALTVLALNVFGDTLRDQLDPHSAQSRGH
ncbi:MAG: peptide/nickel transport system permease protein [Kribbellaceae bacterium]|jgi:peptide/nickel transport system permease protein|nr:peptide/nickel transport system permease protein [Kribbellaceae bacterium]